MFERPLLPPVVWFVLFIVAGLILDRFGPEWSGFDLVGSGWAGAILFGIGLAFGLAGIIQFRGQGTTVDPVDPSRAASLVTGGVYRLTRNPMYVGLALGLLGIFLWQESVLALALVPLFVVVLTAAQILPEEKALRAKFGAEFEAFCERSPRWLFGL